MPKLSGWKPQQLLISPHESAILVVFVRNGSPLSHAVSWDSLCGSWGPTLKMSHSHGWQADTSCHIGAYPGLWPGSLGSVPPDPSAWAAWASSQNGGWAPMGCHTASLRLNRGSRHPLTQMHGVGNYSTFWWRKWFLEECMDGRDCWSHVWRLWLHVTSKSGIKTLQIKRW